MSAKALLAIGPGDLELASLELDVLLAAFKKMRGDFLALGDDLVACLRQRRTADDQRARAVRAHAELHLVGVAADNVDILERHAEFFADDLRIGGFVALAVIVGADKYGDLPGWVDAHGRALVETAARAKTPGDA